MMNDARDGVSICPLSPRACKSYATEGVVRQCTTPLQLGVRRSHNLTVLSRAADKN